MLSSLWALFYTSTSINSVVVFLLQQPKKGKDCFMAVYFLLLTLSVGILKLLVNFLGSKEK